MDYQANSNLISSTYPSIFGILLSVKCMIFTGSICSNGKKPKEGFAIALSQLLKSIMPLPQAVLNNAEEGWLQFMIFGEM